MRVRVTAFLLVLVAAFAVACHKIDHGKVEQKVVRPPFFVLMPMSCGKNCTYLMPIYYPESYYVTVRGFDKQGKEQVENFYLSRSEWDGLKVGDKMSCREATCMTEPPAGKQP